MLLKVSSIDGNTKLDALDTTPVKGSSTPAARRSCQTTGGGYHPQQHTERGAVER